MTFNLDKVADQIQNHELNMKKVRAVKNYFFLNPDHLDVDGDKIEFLSLWIKEEFFDSHAQAMIEQLLADYRIDYLDWCCRVPKLRKEISHCDARRRKFFFENGHDVRINKWLRRTYPQYSKKRNIRQLELF